MGSSKNILVEGIVLHSNDYKDYDKIITIFTKDFGKMQFLAKGVRKINSKNRSSIDIFTYGEYLLNKGKAYYILSQGKVIESYLFLRKDLMKTAVAMTINMFLLDVVFENDPQKEIFSLYNWTLKHLEKSKDPKMLLRYFIVKGILFLGHKPPLERCNDCGEEKGIFFYDFHEGSLLCINCSNVGFQIEKELLDLYTALEKDDFSSLKTLKLTNNMLEKFDFFLSKSIENITDKKFKGFEYLKKLIF